LSTYIFSQSSIDIQKISSNKYNQDKYGLLDNHTLGNIFLYYTWIKHRKKESNQEHKNWLKPISNKHQGKWSEQDCISKNNNSNNIHGLIYKIPRYDNILIFFKRRDKIQSKPNYIKLPNRNPNQSGEAPL
jgi:hypothetical protein